MVGHQVGKNILTGMTKGCVAKVMGQGYRLGQVLVEPQGGGQSAAYLGGLHRVGEPGAVVIALVVYKNLGFVLQSPKGR